jgi:hypothetical protein
MRRSYSNFLNWFKLFFLLGMLIACAARVQSDARAASRPASRLHRDPEMRRPDTVTAV